MIERSKLPLVVVEWNDAWGDTTSVVTPNDVATTHKPEIIRTIGWLLHEDADGVSLANEYCADDSYRGRSFIPRAMVKAMDTLSLAKPRKKRELLDKSGSVEGMDGK